MAEENQTSNRVADAAELLELFIAGDLVTDKSNRENMDAENVWADDRAAIISIQLLAVASATERIAIALESLMAVCAGGERRVL